MPFPSLKHARKQAFSPHYPFHSERQVRSHFIKDFVYHPIEVRISHLMDYRRRMSTYDQTKVGFMKTTKSKKCMNLNEKESTYTVILSTRYF